MTIGEISSFESKHLRTKNRLPEYLVAPKFTGRYYLYFTSKFVILVWVKTEQCVSVIQNLKFKLTEKVYYASLFSYIICCMRNSVDS